jgi:hypothetical protein
MMVLDLETLPDPKATAIAPRGREMARVALHYVAAYSSLAATEDQEGRWSGFALRSVSEADEFDLLMEVDASLSDLIDADGTLVTYNGLSHDLAVLRRRAAAHWMFGLPGLGRADEIAHRDLLRAHAKDRRTAWPSLRDACAGYGIPTDHNLVGRGTVLPASIRKSQVDCVATFLLTLYELAANRGDEAPLVKGWSALADYLATPPIRGPHLDQFRWHPRLAAALDG